MTFDDDFIRLHFSSGHKNVLCKANGISWPPPENINLLGFHFVRESMSLITDKQRADMTHVARGASYQLKI